jgi:hypothetical protein
MTAHPPSPRGRPALTPERHDPITHTSPDSAPRCGGGGLGASARVTALGADKDDAFVSLPGGGVHQPQRRTVPDGLIHCPADRHEARIRPVALHGKGQLHRPHGLSPNRRRPAERSTSSVAAGTGPQEGRFGICRRRFVPRLSVPETGAAALSLSRRAGRAPREGRSALPPARSVPGRAGGRAARWTRSPEESRPGTVAQAQEDRDETHEDRRSDGP